MLLLYERLWLDVHKRVCRAGVAASPMVPARVPFAVEVTHDSGASCAAITQMEAALCALGCIHGGISASALAWVCLCHLCLKGVVATGHLEVA